MRKKPCHTCGLAILSEGLSNVRASSATQRSPKLLWNCAKPGSQSNPRGDQRHRRAEVRLPNVSPPRDLHLAQSRPLRGLL